MNALHRVVRIAAWLAVAACWLGVAAGLLLPRLGGDGPGLQGSLGFAGETIAAGWWQGGVLIAIGAVLTAALRLWRPAIGIAAAAAVVLLPELVPAARRIEAVAPPTPALRIAAINLDEDNEEDPAMERALRDLDADVLVMPECTGSWARRLERWFAGDYPHRWRAVPPPQPGLWLDGLSLAVWSRLPADAAPEIRLLDGIAAQVRVPLRWQGRAFALYGIHPSRPWPRSLYARAWRQRQALLDWLRAETLPVVVAGDFNAVPRSAFVLRLRELGLSLASESVLGRAPPTWSMRPVASAWRRVAIDHVMHGDGFVATGFRRGATTSSDHAPVVAELVWRN